MGEINKFVYIVNCSNLAPMKIKVHTGVEQISYDRILQIASVQYEGNFSMALRNVIEEGLKHFGKFTFHVDENSAYLTHEEVKNIVQANCKHDFGKSKGTDMVCSKCGISWMENRENILNKKK